MRYNLLRPAYQDRNRTRRWSRWYLLGSLGMLVGTALIAPVALFWYSAAQTQRQYVTDVLYPIEGEIHRQHALEEQAEQVMQHQGSQCGPHWSQVLVAMAETKPPAIAVQSLTGDERQVMITGVCDDMALARQWQQALNRQKGLGQTKVKTMKREENLPHTVVWEVTLHGAEGETETQQRL